MIPSYVLNAVMLFSTTFLSIYFLLDEKLIWLQFRSQLEWQALSSCKAWHNMELFFSPENSIKTKRYSGWQTWFLIAGKDSCSMKERPWSLAAVWSLLMDFIWLGAIISVNTVSTSLEERQARKTQNWAPSWVIFSGRIADVVY